jgi:hypothetical protein
MGRPSRTSPLLNEIGEEAPAASCAWFLTGAAGCKALRIWLTTPVASAHGVSVYLNSMLSREI